MASVNKVKAKFGNLKSLLTNVYATFTKSGKEKNQFYDKVNENPNQMCSSQSLLILVEGICRFTISTAFVSHMTLSS